MAKFYAIKDESTNMYLQKIGLQGEANLTIMPTLFTNYSDGETFLKLLSEHGQHEFVIVETVSKVVEDDHD